MRKNLFQLLALGACVFAASSIQADVVVDNLSNSGSASGNGLWDAQEFATGSGVGTEIINSITVKLTFGSGSPSGVDVYLYSIISGKPGSQLDDLGHINANGTTTQNYLLNVSSGPNISAGTDYAIVIQTATGLTWSGGTTLGNTGSGETGSFVNAFHGTTAGSPTWGSALGTQFDLEVTAVPEPINYALVGFGFVFVSGTAGGCYVNRRRFTAAR